MQAMVLDRIYDLNRDESPLHLIDLPVPQLAEHEVLIRVSVCGVCHTELDEIEGRTPPAFFPIILGNQVVGHIAELGQQVKEFKVGERVGVAWIYSACGKCELCLRGLENICTRFKATGRDAHGGYAEFMRISQSFIYRIPEVYDNDAEAAPLLCAGAIGYRALKLGRIENNQVLGLTGFGASGHLVLKMSRYLFPQTRIFVFARSKQEQEFARELGADWVGDSSDQPPAKAEVIIDTTPVWKPVLQALKNLQSGGRLIINAIRKENVDRDYLLSLDYPSQLWLEKEIKSVANITRTDVGEFLKLAALIPIRPAYQEFTLSQANLALQELKQRKIRGAKVLRVE
jgi:propanol-preferring alcohol dehydrogenase